MFTITFITDRFGPYTFGCRVSLRWGPEWKVDRGGTYVNGAWRFELEEANFPDGLTFKFVVAPERWMDGDNLTLRADECVGEVPYVDTAYTFSTTAIITERSAVAQRFFPRNLSEDHVYDAIIVGSGMGGGILASTLARHGKDVLLLEAGSYLFPTHVGNLPRRLEIGSFDKHVWSLWPDFRVVSYQQEPTTSEYEGGQGFNLGGRSIFWGALIPRQAGWELSFWPTAVAQYLTAPNGDPSGESGYDRAEKELGLTPVAPTAYEKKAIKFIRKVFEEFVAVPAPMAVQRRGRTDLSIPAGFFSTADLLMEDCLLPAASVALTINLNTAVTEIAVDPADAGRVTGVVAHDLLADRIRQFQARAVVLAAGALETPRIALQSGLGQDHPLIGRGLTDHTIGYRHFVIPSSAQELFDDRNSAKILLRHPSAPVGGTAFDVVVELGSDWNQGRYLDPENAELEAASRKGSMMGEIVVLFHAPLENGNTVTLGGNGRPADPLVVQMRPVDPTDADWAEADRLATTLLTGSGWQPVPGAGEENWPSLVRAKLGAVSHEVGTMRMSGNHFGVVDQNLLMEGFDNLYVCDNSVFPVSPAANPSVTLAALAIRLADHLGTTSPAPQPSPTRKPGRAVSWWRTLLAAGRIPRRG